MKMYLIILLSIIGTSLFSYNEKLHKSVFEQIVKAQNDLKAGEEVSKIIYFTYPSEFNVDVKKMLKIKNEKYNAETVSYFDLSNSVFKDLNLNNFKFGTINTKQEIVVINLSNCKFENCDLQKFADDVINYTSADFVESNLGYNVFIYAPFSKFINCSLLNTNFSMMDLSSTGFIDCNLQGAKFLDIDGLPHVYFNGSNLRGTQFSDDAKFIQKILKASGV